MKKLDPTKATKYNFSEERMNNGATPISNFEQLKELVTVPVEETKVYFAVEKGKTKLLAPNHKAIVVANEIVAVQKKSYKLVPNEKIIMPVIERLSETGFKWEIDERHSFLTDTRMRISLKFPELVLNPDGHKIELALNVNNSYDATERVRMILGAYRVICSNGMIIGKILEKQEHKHTVNFSVENLAENIYRAYDAIPQVEARLQLLNQTEFKMTDKIEEKIEQEFGKRAIAYVRQELGAVATEWDMYNVLTYYISHYINIANRMKYQARLSEWYEV